ncbi:hypothetical protein BJY01DRAFT_253943 [Aspergillus pseudoustus]|uniref:Uncharacterized protein n=1 Tax=Aspergillus pseudoustus TaxID=1810923 RepID=A0ABR4IZN8_9EURO
MATGFTNWASQSSPYRTIIPWASYNERNPSNTTTDLVPESSLAATETISFHLTSSRPSPQQLTSTRPLRSTQHPMFEPLEEDKRSIKTEEDLGKSAWLDTVPHVQLVDITKKTGAQSITVPRTSTVSLGSLDLGAVSDSKILYYFGALATQARLLPKFHLTLGRKQDRWGIKMTMYGMTFVRSHVYASRKDAKVDICREALKRLKTEHPKWLVPERPRDSPAPVEWDWTYLLHRKGVLLSRICLETNRGLKEHCVQQGHDEPKYTKYEHQRGYRHEVEVGGGTYFGVLKHYPDEHSSEQAAAHLAFYDMLVRGESDNTEPQSLSTFEAWKKRVSPLVPRDPLRLPSEPHLPAKREREDHERSRAPKRRVRKSRSPTKFSSAQGSMPKNANLQPLENRRLAAIEVEAPVVEEKRWKVTPQELWDQIRDLRSWAAKLESNVNPVRLDFYLQYRLT